jgi:hypothetical protein
MNCAICTTSIEVNYQELNDKCFCGDENSKSQFSSFSSYSPIFISPKVESSITEAISVIEKVLHSDTFQKSLVTNLNPKNSSGGILSCYDFHLDGDIPKLIEINTNAGGFFLNYELLKSSTICCSHTKGQSIENLEEKIISMFRNEFKKTTNKELKTVAIIDENPETQFLYPDMVICKNILEKNGIKAFVVDSKDLQIVGAAAQYNGTPIDLVYNRLTDFYFKNEENKKFLPLLGSKTTVISPNSNDYTLFADKANLLHLQNVDIYKDVLSQNEMDTLKKSLLETILVTKDKEGYLWENRKKYFFKPINGFGGRGAYNGKGLTKKVWGYISINSYIAQETVPANTKNKLIEGKEESFKFDIRAYTYAGTILLLGARVYQGQTTNFRTLGGGFGSVFITKNN